jgi:hypothetical protein
MAFTSYLAKRLLTDEIEEWHIGTFSRLPTG